LPPSSFPNRSPAPLLLRTPAYSAMRNVKITLQYDGTDYHGWQIQPNGRTIQGELTRAVSLLDHRQVTVHGAGRTDAGVHAEGQVASFSMERDFSPCELRDAINGNLDRDIRVLEAEFVESSFNARFSALSKTYRYRIWTADVVSPFVRRYVYHYRGALDLEAMLRAMEPLVGTHDFSAFTVASSEAESHVRTLHRLDIEYEENGIAIIIVADGFLRYMVRTIVGTMIDVGRGRIPAANMAAILESKDRARAGTRAPAAGLTLMRVDY
ncbi:MAG: tRNA pseudouridine(38-40) synthase TruA, partial [Blastocatellia bacterium]|nr:tRNA pseudouridine(38-40) synthase TruA [Blastocatellia bacterium]